MSHRPIIVHGESEVVVRLLDSYDSANVSFDGQAKESVALGDHLRVKQHENFVHLLHPKGYDYFEIIRSKLHWGHQA
jgi:NAD+ kinase